MVLLLCDSEHEPLVIAPIRAIQLLAVMAENRMLRPITVNQMVTGTRVRVERSGGWLGLQLALLAFVVKLRNLVAVDLPFLDREIVKIVATQIDGDEQGGSVSPHWVAQTLCNRLRDLRL